MAVFSTAKTVPLDKDLGCANALSSYLGTAAREQLSVVLQAIDNAFLSLSNSSSTGLTNETNARVAADQNLQNQINSEITNRTNADNAITTAYTLADTNAATARANADTILQNEIDGERALLRMSVVGTDKVVTIAAGFGIARKDATGATSTVRAIPNGSLVSDFPGASINFTTGVITYVGGTTQAFTPISFAGQASKFAKYAIVLLPGVPNTLLILNGTSFGTTAALATAPAFSGGVAIGLVAVQDTGVAGSGTIQNITYTSLIEFSSAGSGGSGSGSGSPLDPNFDETFIYYTRSDFSVDTNTFLASTTGTDSVLGLGKVILGVGQTLTSKDLVGPQLRQDAQSINVAQARILYKTGKVDLIPTVEFTRDGGISWAIAPISYPGSVLSSDYVSTLIEADLNFDVTASTALYAGGASNASLSSGQRVAALFTPTYRTVITSFDALLRTTATAGTVQGKITTVSTGIPVTTLRSSGQVFAAGQDIVSTSSTKTFTFQPLTLEVGVTYAFVVEGTSLNANVSWDQTASTPAFNVSSATHNGSGWAASAARLSFNVFGTGLDFRVRITSGTAASEIAGFGINMVQDTIAVYTGDASWEERIISLTEAQTGLITLTSARFVPGTHQLHCNFQGHDFVAPDFIEVSNSQVLFAANFFQTGDKVRFYTSYGLVDSSSIGLSKMAALFEAIVGSAAQVSAGTATHATIQSAVDAVAVGGKVYVLQGSYTENLSVTKEVCIHGKGRSSILNGTVTFGIGSTGAMLKFMKILDNVTINSAAQAVYVSDNWIATTKTVSGGTNCFILNIGE